MINRTIHIAFLGPQGTYSHIALKQYANIHQYNKIVEYSCQDFNEVVKRLKKKQVKYGILPIENSSSGSINEVYDILQTTHLFLIGEINIPIKHCILANPDTTFQTIKKIYTHPQPFQQCSLFFKQFSKLKIIFCHSSADAMRQVSQLKSPNLAALGNEQSGTLLYELQVLKKNIANKKNNTTRFVILGNKKIKINKNTPAKTTLSLSTKYQSNILIKISSILNIYNITILHVKIRPIKCYQLEKIIFIDIEANLYNQKIQYILKKLQKMVPSIKILGCYPKAPALTPITLN